MDWAFNVPIKFKYKTLDDAKSSIKNACTSKNTALLMSSTAIKRYGLTELIEELTQIEGFVLLDRVTPNPSPEDIYYLLEKIKGKKTAQIIAVGGGSAIDSAKAVAALYTFIKSKTEIQTEIKDYKDITTIIKNKTYKKESLADKTIPIIAVPTTAGTGSEATMWATIWDKDNHKKMSVEAPWLYPQESWLVPELTLGMTAKLTLATGLDALCHAVEAYWSKNSNPIVRSLSKEAISTISKNLPLAIKEPKNLEYREKMLTGATLAGLSFSNTRTTACHSISYPMTSLYGIDHGFAVAVVLYGVLSRNIDAIIDKESLFEAFGGKNLKDIKKWLDETTEPVMPLRLSSFGLTRDDLETIARESFTEGRMDNNPVPLTEKDVREILHEAF